MTPQVRASVGGKPEGILQSVCCRYLAVSWEAGLLMLLHWPWLGCYSVLSCHFHCYFISAPVEACGS